MKPYVVKIENPYWLNYKSAMSLTDAENMLYAELIDILNEEDDINIKSVDELNGLFEWKQETNGKTLICTYMGYNEPIGTILGTIE